MIPRLWTYFLKRALSNILEQRFIQFISMGTITISFLLLGAFVLLVVNLNTWLMDWGQSLSMSVYLEDGISGKRKEEISEALKGIPGAELRGFISKEKAMEDLKEAFGAQAALLDGFKENPLPASFELLLLEKEFRNLAPDAVKDEIESLQGVEEVQYSEQWIERFEGFLYVIQAGGLIIGGLLCLAVLFITTNTIKLTIYARRDELEIYKLVGATDRFVKTPFLIEGAIQGFVGGATALAFLYGLYKLVSVKPLYASGFPVLKVVFLAPEIALSLIFLSLILGLIGGLIAVGRFFH
ncbi:MAG: permease-like cell division protein FtsX [Thermodesulfobacteriota bacterium]